MNTRLKKIKKLIQVTVKNGHLYFTVKSKEKTIKQLSNIHCGLSTFETNVCLIHVYKLICKSNDNKMLKSLIYNSNYAGVFGSPWELEK